MNREKIFCFLLRVSKIRHLLDKFKIFWYYIKRGVVLKMWEKKSRNVIIVFTIIGIIIGVKNGNVKKMKEVFVFSL